MTRFASPADRGDERDGQDEPDERDAASQDPRRESVAQRADRNIAELVQELRVVGLGVQVLFGFLLSLPFTMRFTKLDGAQRDLYLTSLVLAAVATTLLIGPVAYHRLVFRRGMKEQLVRFANASPLSHNVTVQEPGGGATLGATPTFSGATKSLTLNLKAGTYAFFCSVPGHRQAGMQGTLTVQ